MSNGISIMMMNLFNDIIMVTFQQFIFTSPFI